MLKEPWLTETLNQPMIQPYGRFVRCEAIGTQPAQSQ
jgi:hypothetical protein